MDAEDIAALLADVPLRAVVDDDDELRLRRDMAVDVLISEALWLKERKRKQRWLAAV